MNQTRLEYWISEIEAGIELDDSIHEATTSTSAAAIDFVNEYRKFHG